MFILLFLYIFNSNKRFYDIKYKKNFNSKNKKLMSNFKRKNVKQMSIKELDDYIQKNSLKQKNSNTNFNIDKNKTFIQNDEKNIFSNILNYNYLDNENNKLPDKDINDNNELEIQQLLKENRELKFDMKQLFVFTDQNINELKIKINELSDENFILKQEINELKNKLILQANIITNTEIDKHEIINEKKIMKDRYDNEIKELNCQLNNYKSKLNYLNLEYQNLLENFHKLKQESIFNEYKRKNPYENKIFEENKQFSIDNTRNKIDNNNLNNINNEYINKTEEQNKINKNDLNNISQYSKSNKSINNSNKKLKRSKTSFQKKIIKKNNSNLKNKNYNNLLRSKKKTVKKNSPNKKNNLLISDSNFSSKRYLTSYNNSDSNKTLKVIDEEIFNLEKKLNELNISYQNFLQNLKQIPDNNFKESENLKNTLKYLQETIEDKNKKLKELKFKQQKFLIQSKVNN